ncbi:hypothetical protein DYB35_013447 [Aphanomyces astaci]|uniref:Uncharacterized protein n=1 Tax=Aphanomyces astaci TaxID=112090 RepID=A0A3R7AKR6_APHAT|nr:hypothetical protein DYB35_013447 [Aphanomyces astaci]
MFDFGKSHGDVTEDAWVAWFLEPTMKNPLNVFCYVKWLRQFAIGYQLYGGMDEEKPSTLPAEEPRKENSRPHAKVKKLMDDFHQPRRRSVNFVSSTKPANSMECQASIEDTLVSEGLLVALERLGASLNVETKPGLMLKPYGETTESLHVTRQVQFKTVTLETSINPLVLLDDMLVDALKQRRVWDIAEAGDADQTSANVNRLQEAFQEDPEDALYAEGVAACSKPGDQDGEIKRILDGKIPRPSSLASPLCMKANSGVFWMIAPMSFAWILGKTCRWMLSR